jgi:hypothetical protein
MRSRGAAGSLPVLSISIRKSSPALSNPGVKTRHLTTVAESRSLGVSVDKETQEREEYSEVKERNCDAQPLRRSAYVMMGSLSIRTSSVPPPSPKLSDGGTFPLLPFTNLGPIEWEFHGLQARVANSPMHGSKRYWVTYCPSNGISHLGLALT